MEIIKIKVEQVIPYENNPRKNDGAVAAVVESIKQCGYCSPIIIDENNMILCGHTRLKALKQLGYKEVECVRKLGMTEDEKKKYRILDNKTAEIAEWDFDLLNEELKNLDFGDFDFGFDMSAFECHQEIVEDEAPEVDEKSEPITQLGNIYKLGEHRLMCGDSTDTGTVAILMDGKKADLFLTDPPYNVALGHHDTPEEARQRHRRTDGLLIMNDKMEDGEFFEFLLKCFTAGKEALKEGGSFYIWHADNEGLNFRAALKESGLSLRQTLIWNKNAITLGRQDYQWKHEPCLYGWKDGARHSWYSDRSQSTVLDFKKPTRSEEHPTMKPVELFAYQIQNSTKKGDIVLDLFGGSGTTIIACEQTGRIGYSMELDPKYCDVIIKRWEKLTGQKAVLVNG